MYIIYYLKLPKIRHNKEVPKENHKEKCQIMSEKSENSIIVKSCQLGLVCKLSALLLLPVTQPGNCRPAAKCYFQHCQIQSSLSLSQCVQYCQSQN